MRHVLARNGSVPMSLVGLDQDHVASLDWALAGLVGNDSLTMGHDQHLLRAVPVPPVACSIDEGYGRHPLGRCVTFGDEILAHHRANEHLFIGPRHTLRRIVGYDLDHRLFPFLKRPAPNLAWFRFSRMGGRDSGSIDRELVDMKVAVISDIHGYSLALESVLADIGREPGIDMIVAAGDLCEGGPDPRGVLRILEEHSIHRIRGNTDRDLVEGMRSSKGATWVTEELGREGLEHLASLPFDLRVPPPGGRERDDDLLVVHANPFDEDQQLPPSASDSELREILGDTRAAVIAFGHIHIAYQRVIDSIQLIDVSAVGNPKDEDFRSRWGLCTWDEETTTWTTELRYVPYPLAATLVQMEASGMPNWSKAATKLQRATYREQ